MAKDEGPRILYVEPWQGGSHAAFSRALTQRIRARWVEVTLSARHWKWRMRGSAVWAALARPAVRSGPFDLVFASSYVPLAELVGLVPALAAVPRILYFHENQLAFPWRGEAAERDHHFGFTQLVSALAATRCVFNSEHNRRSFLDAGRELLSRMPDAVPPQWIDAIEARSEVLGVPLDLPDVPPAPDTPADARAEGPIVLWNHRWEHDKDPEAFFAALGELDDRGVPFRLAVCGQRFSRAPASFDAARQRHAHRIVHFDPVDDRRAYEALLARCHIAVSTARHEFFGIAMLEATHFGARPLVPDALAYPEHFDADARYPDAAALVDTLEAWCRAWCAGEDLRADRRVVTRPRLVEALIPRYEELLARVRAMPVGR